MLVATFSPSRSSYDAFTNAPSLSVPIESPSATQILVPSSRANTRGRVERLDFPLDLLGPGPADREHEQQRHGHPDHLRHRRAPPGPVRSSGQSPGATPT